MVLSLNCAKMAPSPEQHNEPKAPDKSDSASATKSNNKSPATEQQKHLTKFKNSSQSESQDKKVSDLDYGEVRELLEEAINYRCPKDRNGKSSLFRELLQDAEADERNQRATNASGSQVVRHYNTAYSQRNKNKHSKDPSAAERNSHGGSLQDLYQAACENTSSKKARKKSSVSARQREGGSLPSCNIVPVDKITFETPTISTTMETNHVQAANALSNVTQEFKASDTIKIEPEESLATDSSNNNVSFHDNDVELKECYKENGTELQVISQIARIPMHYTSRASLEISDTRKNNEVDTNVTFFEQRKNTNGFETKPLQLPSSYNAVKCILENPNETTTARNRNTTLAKDVISGQSHMSVYNLQTKWFPSFSEGLSRISVQSCKDSNEKKPFDENANNLGSFSATQSSGPETRKKPKSKQKTERNVTIVDHKQLSGYCGDKSLEDLVSFIENKEPQENKQFHKSNKGDSDRGGKKRSTDRKGKDKSEKLKKSNSLEEISKSKLEDLTAAVGEETSSRRSTKKQATFDDKLFSERSKEDDDEQLTNSNKDKNRDKDKEVKLDSVDSNSTELGPSGDLSPEVSLVESSEFHVVTKKKKSKKRASTSGCRGNLFHEDNRRNTYYQRDNQSKFQAHDHCDSDMYLKKFPNSSPDHRRKSTSSMPPSDKSNDSSDLDSVHSLPVESTSKKMCVQQVSTSSGGTPQASYADIAKIANVNTPNSCSNNYGVDIKNTEKWPSVTNSNNNNSNISNVISTNSSNVNNSIQNFNNNNNNNNHTNVSKTVTTNKCVNQSNAVNLNNYNFPDLIIDNYPNDNISCKYDKMFTPVSEIEAKHLSEAKIKYKLKNKLDNASVTSPPNSRILQDQYPSLEKTVINKVEIKNKKSGNGDKINLSNNKNKLKNNSGSNCEIPITTTKGCDNDRKLSNSPNDTSQERYELILQSNHKVNVEKKPSHNAAETKSNRKGNNASSRPAVIILNDTDNNSTGITFGFEINETLLMEDLMSEQSEIENGETDVSSEIPDNSPQSIESQAFVSSQDIGARFVSPVQFTRAIGYNQEKIMSFVALAWDDLMNEKVNGKNVVYWHSQMDSD